MHVWSLRQSLIDDLTDLASIKSGLIVSEGRALQELNGIRSAWWNGDRNQMIRINMEDFEESMIRLLFRVGYIEDEENLSGVAIRFVRQNTAVFGLDNDNPLGLIEKVSLLLQHLSRAALYDEAIPEPFAEVYGITQLLKDYKDRYVFHYQRPDSVPWDTAIPLDELFAGESIPKGTTSGSYFDQRYIDFLCRQPEHLNNIHWRQFEYMTGEYFQRNGYKVELTPPRGDGGIDVIARKANDILGPEMVIVQCKRYGNDQPVGVDAVRAFWATVSDSGATRGVIATTSRLTSGALDYCAAKQFRLGSANNDKLLAWLSAMRGRRA